MVIRLFRYGFEKAAELVGNGSENEVKPVVLEFPRQLVIFLEENEKIADELAMNLRLPSGEVIPYTVPVMKYWKYTAAELRQQRMYALLPLQAFKVRKKIQAIFGSRRTDAEKSQLITEQFALLKDTIEQTINVLRELHDQQEIQMGDLERILRVLRNINEYLYNKYGEYRTIEEEVDRMVKTLFDPVIWQEGIKEGKMMVAKRLLYSGLNLREVSEVTELSIEEVRVLLNPTETDV